MIILKEMRDSKSTRIQMAGCFRLVHEDWMISGRKELLHRPDHQKLSIRPGWEPLAFENP
jgi:hypothetical protein